MNWTGHLYNAIQQHNMTWVTLQIHRCFTEGGNGQSTSRLLFMGTQFWDKKKKRTCVVFALTFFLYIFTWGRGHLFMCQNGKALFKQEIRTGLLCVNIVSNQSQAKQHSHGKAKSKLAWSKSSRKDSKTHSPIDWKISELRRIKLLPKTSKWALLDTIPRV